MSGDENPQNPQFAASAIKANPDQAETQHGTAAAAAPAKKKQKKPSGKRKSA